MIKIRNSITAIKKLRVNSSQMKQMLEAQARDTVSARQIRVNKYIIIMHIV